MLKQQVKHLYKQLLFTGREYPLGYSHFRSKCHAAFMRKAHLTDEAEIIQAIKHGEYVLKELESLWFLKKYRHVKKAYE